MTSNKRPNELPALKALEKINGGSLTSEALVESWLAQIRVGAVTLSNRSRANLAGKFGSRRDRHGLPGIHYLVAKLP